MIEISPVPPAVRAAAEGGFPILLRAHRAGLGKLTARPAEEDEVWLGAPHPVYTLTVDQAVSGHLPEEPSGYRYLIRRSSGTLAGAAEVVRSEGGFVAHRVEDVSPRIESLRLIVDELETVPVIAQHPHEMRLLRVPAMFLEILWLHGAADLVEALPPAYSPFDSAGPMSLEEFLSVLSATARRRRAEIYQARGMS